MGEDQKKRIIKNRAIYWLIILLIGINLAACQSAVTPEPTATQEVTVVPTLTSTLEPSSTPTETVTPTPEPTPTSDPYSLAAVAAVLEDVINRLPADENLYTNPYGWGLDSRDTLWITSSGWDVIVHGVLLAVLKGQPIEAGPFNLYLRAQESDKLYRLEEVNGLLVLDTAQESINNQGENDSPAWTGGGWYVLVLEQDGEMVELQNSAFQLKFNIPPTATPESTKTPKPTATP